MSRKLLKAKGKPTEEVVWLPPIAIPPPHAEGEELVDARDGSVEAHGVGCSPRFVSKRCQEERPSSRQLQVEQRPPKLTHSVSQRVWQLSNNASRARRQGLTRASSTLCVPNEKPKPTESVPSSVPLSSVCDGGRRTAREPGLVGVESKLSMLNVSRSKLTLPTWGGLRGSTDNRNVKLEKDSDDSLETAERWLAETLDQNPSVAALKRADEILCTLDFSRADSVERRSSPQHKFRKPPTLLNQPRAQWSSRRSLVLSGIGRRELRAQRVPLPVLERVYPALYVYSSGVFEFLRKATAHCDDANVVLASLWTAYAMLLEECFPSEYEMAVQGVTKNLANTVNTLSERFESRFEYFIKEEKRNQTKIISLEHEVSRSKLRNERLEDDLSNTKEKHKSVKLMRQILASQSLDLSQELQKVTTKSEKLQQENMRLNANFECSQRLLQVERDRTVKLELSVKIEKARASNLITSLSDLDNEILKLRLDVKTKSEVIQCLEASSTSFSEQLDSKTRNLEEMSSSFSRTREAFAALQVSHNELCEETQNLRDRQSKLSWDLESTQTALTEQVVKRHEAESSLADVPAKLSEISDRLKEAVSARECLHQENSGLLSELRSDQEKLADVLASEKILKAKLAALEHQHSSLQVSSQKTKQLMDEAQKECGITSKKLIESERKLKHEQKNATALHKKKIEEAAKFRSRIESINQVVGSMRNEVAVTREAKRNLESDHTKLLDQLKVKSLECEVLTRQVSAARRELSLSQVAQSDLRKQLQTDRASLERNQQANTQLAEQARVAKAARFQEQKRADHSRVQMKSAAAERDTAVSALKECEKRLANERSERTELEAEHEATVVSLRSKLSSLQEKAKLAEVFENVKMPREKRELLLLLNEAGDLEIEIENAKNAKVANKEFLEKVAAEIAKQKSALAARVMSLAQVQAEVDATKKSLEELLASKTYALYESKVVELKKAIQDSETRCTLLQSSLDEVEEVKSQRCTRTQATQIGADGLQKEWKLIQLSKLRDAVTESEISFGVEGRDLRREVRSLMKVPIVRMDNGTQTDGEGVPTFSLVGYFDKNRDSVAPPAPDSAARERKDRDMREGRTPRTMLNGRRIGGGGHASSTASLFSPRRKRKLRLARQQTLHAQRGEYNEMALHRHSSISYLLVPSVVETACRPLPSNTSKCHSTALTYLPEDHDSLNFQVSSKSKSPP